MSARKARPPEQSEPRSRLLAVATRLFSDRGFDAVSTREICTGAGLNPGAIHYHFGDKDGLYREVLRAPVEALNAQLGGFDDPALDLHEAIRHFLAPFLVSDAACGTQLFMREMQQPSAQFMEVVAREVAPHFETFKAVLARHAGLAADDPAIAQLAMGLQAMAHDYALSRPLIDALYPDLLAGDPQLQHTARRLADWGCALVAFERERPRS